MVLKSETCCSSASLKVFAQPASPANCSRKNIPRASLFVGPLTGGSSYSEGVGSASPEILIFTLPLCNTLCMSWERRCSPILGVPTQWVNANDFCDRIGLSGARIFFRFTRSSRRKRRFFFGIFPFFSMAILCGVSP